MHLRCILEVKMIGIPDELDAGSKDQRIIKDDCGVFALNNYMNDHFIEWGWVDWDKMNFEGKNLEFHLKSV